MDCGGGCPKCGNGTTCNVGTDCSSNVCYQSQCCGPKSCSSQSLSCGSASDGCGNTLACGSCNNHLQCQSGKCTCVASQCTGCFTPTCCKSSTQCGCQVVLSCF
jgi:hypothetical protein